MKYIDTSGEFVYFGLMPIRVTPLVTGEIYHVLNRGVSHQPTFQDKFDYQRALEVISFYRFLKPPIRFSFYNRLNATEKEAFWRGLVDKSPKLVTFLAYCLMPNHFHFLIKQEVEGGISKFLANFQNSYTKYFNTHHDRSGHLFQGQFKAIRMETENQLLYVSRYIHLNPFTSYVVKTVDELKTYPWSSLPEYLESSKEGICETRNVLVNFSSKSKYFQFILDQKDYQRKLQQIKHLVLEK